MHLLTLASSICLPSSEALFSTSEIVIALLLLFPVINTIFRLQSEFSVKYSKFQGGIQEIHGQYVAQYPDGTSIRTLETRTQFLRRPFQFSVNEVFRMKAEHFSFKMKVLAILKACETVVEDAVLFR